MFADVQFSSWGLARRFIGYCCAHPFERPPTQGAEKATSNRGHSGLRCSGNIAEVRIVKQTQYANVVGQTEQVSPRLGELSGPALKSYLLKRPFDIVLSLMGLALSAPLWPLVALAIKLEDGGPLIYKQRRWGRGGVPFTVFKFRTMVADSDQLYGVRMASEDDSRITRAGRVLRRTGLDELPQFVNILRGDMSFVGPRALALGEKAGSEHGAELRYEDLDGFALRQSVRPGLTGTSTIYHPKDIDADAKFASDIDYVLNHSLGQDMRLVLVSLWVSVRGKWETRASKV